MKVAIYSRVSTNVQTTENQLLPLNEYVERMNYELVNIYQDEGISGSKGRDQRPALNEMMKDAVKGKFKKVLVFDVSRLGRSLKDLINIMTDLKNQNIDFYFYNQGIDTTSSTGQMMFNLLGVLAQWELGQISERSKAGIARARAEGKTIGRPTTINESVEKSVLMLRDKEYGIRKIATELKIGVGSVMRILQKEELKDEKYDVPLISQAM